jgi:hypothetical protein
LWIVVANWVAHIPQNKMIKKFDFKTSLVQKLSIWIFISFWSTLIRLLQIWSAKLFFWSALLLYWAASFLEMSSRFYLNEQQNLYEIINFQKNYIFGFLLNIWKNPKNENFCPTRPEPSTVYIGIKSRQLLSRGQLLIGLLYIFQHEKNLRVWDLKTLKSQGWAKFWVGNAGSNHSWFWILASNFFLDTRIFGTFEKD